MQIEEEPFAMLPLEFHHKSRLQDVEDVEKSHQLRLAFGEVGSAIDPASTTF